MYKPNDSCEPVPVWGIYSIIIVKKKFATDRKQTPKQLGVNTCTCNMNLTKTVLDVHVVV